VITKNSPGSSTDENYHFYSISWEAWSLWTLFSLVTSECHLLAQLKSGNITLAVSTIPKRRRHSVKKCKLEWNSLVRYVSLCHDSRKLLMNVTAREKVWEVLSLCNNNTAEHRVLWVSTLCSIRHYKRNKCRLWMKGIERTKCNGAFSSAQSENSRGSWTQPHWPGWIKEKVKRRDHGKKRERKGEGKRREVSHLYSIVIWVDGSLQELWGALFPLCNLYPQSNNQMWCQWAVSSLWLLLSLIEWQL